MRWLACLMLFLSLVGCLHVDPLRSGEVVVGASDRVATDNPAEEKSGAFFLRRSLLCRKVFAEAVTNLSARTGRAGNALRGATICGIGEGYTNGVYSLQLEVAWSPAREEAAGRLLSVTNGAGVVAYVPSVDEGENLAMWIGPKQIQDADGTVHFLGFSAMAIGRNTVLSAQNIRRAELDAQAMAVRPFLGTGLTMTDVKAQFCEVMRMKGRHPLCPDREMFVCGYEVVALEMPNLGCDGSNKGE